MVKKYEALEGFKGYRDIGQKLKRDTEYFLSIFKGIRHTVKPFLVVTPKEDQTLDFKNNYRLIQVKSIAECSKRAFCNSFDLH